MIYLECAVEQRDSRQPQLGGWALLSSCHVIPAELSHLGPVLEGAQEFHSLLCTEAPTELWKMSLRWKFAGVSLWAAAKHWGDFKEDEWTFLLARMLPKAKLCDGGWYQCEWEIGWAKLNLEIIYCRIKREQTVKCQPNILWLLADISLMDQRSELCCTLFLLYF